MIRAADNIVDMGPGAGEAGGNAVFIGDWNGKSLWDASKHVLTEIASLRPVLESEGKSRTVGATNGIETWAKEFDGHWYVIAANSTERPQEAWIDVSELSDKDQPEVLFEKGRKCGFDDGRIRDDFSADGAHVYRLAAGG